MTTLNDSLPCPLCGANLEVKPCRPSKAGKNSLHVRCPVDGRHLRGFIAVQPLVNQLLEGLNSGSTAPEPALSNTDSKGADPLGSAAADDSRSRVGSK